MTSILRLNSLIARSQEMHRLLYFRSARIFLVIFVQTVADI